MTLDDIYKKCKCWMFEKSSSINYNNYIVEITNQKLSELFQENNMCRMFNGLAPLTEIPQVTALTDDLDALGIMEEYQKEVLPLGIDAEFLMDDDLNKMSRFDTKYFNARMAHQKTVSLDKIKELTEN